MTRHDWLTAALLVAAIFSSVTGWISGQGYLTTNGLVLIAIAILTDRKRPVMTLVIRCPECHPLAQEAS